MAVSRVFDDLEGGSRPPLLDSIIFEYVGWYVANGGQLYVDIWEIKPPLAYELPVLLAVAVDGQLDYHLLAVVATSAAAVGCVQVVGGSRTEIRCGDLDRAVRALRGQAALAAPFKLPVTEVRS